MDTMSARASGSSKPTSPDPIDAKDSKSVSVADDEEELDDATLELLLEHGALQDPVASSGDTNMNPSLAKKLSVKGADGKLESTKKPETSTTELPCNNIR